MERVLWLYSLPYDTRYPVGCFDERPCFLIGEEVAPLNAKPGQVARQHYAYTKSGSACLLAAIEPLTGRRLVHVQAQRTKREYTRSSCKPSPRATPRPRRSAWCRTPSTPMTPAASTKPSLPRRPSLSPSAASSFLLYSEKCQLAEPDRDRVLGLGA